MNPRRTSFMRWSDAVGRISHWKLRLVSGWNNRAVPLRFPRDPFMINAVYPRELVNTCAMNDLSSYFTVRNTMPLSSIYMLFGVAKVRRENEPNLRFCVQIGAVFRVFRLQNYKKT